MPASALGAPDNAGGFLSILDPHTVQGVSLSANDVWYKVAAPVQPVVPTNTLFGARAGPASGGSSLNYSTDLPRVTAAFTSGGALPCERIYTGTGTQFPGFCAIPTTTSLTTITSNVADPDQTVAGVFDAQYRAFFAGLTKQCFFSPVVQEPDTGKMTAAQANAAINHVHDLAVSVGNPLVSVGVILTSFQIKTQGVAAMKAWVGSKSDWVGVDCYANYGIPVLATLKEALTYGQSLASACGVPMIVPEISYGGGSGLGGLGFTAAQIATMVSDAVAYIKAQKMLAATWFESNKTPVPPGDGNWCLETALATVPSPAAQATWTAACDASIAGLSH